MFSRLLKCCIFSIHGIEHNIARPFSGISSCHQSIPKSIKIHPKIRKAIVDKSPVVALESAIISHGMKYPFNFQTALEVESVVRSQGALPATIGLINGEIHVGLTEDQISFLSEYKTNCIKISRRDLSYAMAKKLHGGTTVSGTMIIAHMVGIPIFVTGGIGGVHRGGQNSMDVSADLTELDKALQEAESTVVGRDVTPFVLSKVAELTDGKSVITNIDLIKNNAKHGAQIAVEYSKMISSDKIHELSMKEDPGDSQPVG
ncbi:Pseudouridine-5'-phosphate glycosidase [Armadillidium vulgare]|nr:Pseudouridine-5'-phosphate glycosidase [Armadillidium vulgare]